MKKFIFNGKYDGNESSLPQREHPAGAVAYREPDQKKFSSLCAAGSVILIIIFVALAVVRGSVYIKEMDNPILIPIVLSFVCAIPHEFLHGICFSETVYMYTALNKGMIFVTGTEDFSKGRFIFMCLLPNIVFAFIPFIVGMIYPRWVIVAIFGALGIGGGIGDYVNVYNTVTQVPKDAKIYMSGFHTYWYKPQA